MKTSIEHFLTVNIKAGSYLLLSTIGISEGTALHLRFKNPNEGLDTIQFTAATIGHCKEQWEMRFCKLRLKNHTAHLFNKIILMVSEREDRWRNMNFFHSIDALKKIILR